MRIVVYLLFLVISNYDFLYDSKERETPTSLDSSTALAASHWPSLSGQQASRAVSDYPCTTSFSRSTCLEQAAQRYPSWHCRDGGILEVSPLLEDTQWTTCTLSPLWWQMGQGERHHVHTPESGTITTWPRTCPRTRTTWGTRSTRRNNLSPIIPQCLRPRGVKEENKGEEKEEGRDRGAELLCSNTSTSMEPQRCANQSSAHSGRLGFQRWRTIRIDSSSPQCLSRGQEHAGGCQEDLGQVRGAHTHTRTRS